MKIKLYLCCATFLLLSCSRKMTPDNYEKCQIIFGNGGGFANLINEYHLLENKRLYHKKNTDTSFAKLGKQNADSVNLLFAKTKALMADTNALHNPGNMYYFIKLKDKNKTQEVTWGGAKENADESILQKAKELYKELMNLVNLKE
jgi:hypothetical protein